MRNRNLWVLGIALVLIAAVCIAAFLIPQQRILTDDAPVLPTADPADAGAQDSAPEPTEAASTETGPSETAPAIADAYLLATVRGVLYEPIPLYSEGSYTIRQAEANAENVIHVTPDSVYMESSTCDNQDCVLQGTVTLDNMKERVLGNMIICLPNEVTLELYTPEDLVSVLTQMQ